MRQGIRKIMPLAGLCLVLLTTGAIAQGQGPQKDVFKGKLFALNYDRAKKSLAEALADLRQKESNL